MRYQVGMVITAVINAEADSSVQFEELASLVADQVEDLLPDVQGARYVRLSLIHPQNVKDIEDVVKEIE